MNLLGNTYIFYADVYFIQNFIIKIAVLYLTLYCNKYQFLIKTAKGIGKILFAAFIGTMIEIVGLLLGNSYNLFLLLVHLLEIPFMVLLVVGKNRSQMWKIMISGYFFIMVINAILEMLWNWFGVYGNYLFLLCVACGMAYIGICVWKNYTHMQKGIYPVEILYAKKQIITYGFYDSGNRLIDPYTKKGVHIISPDLISQLQMEGSKEVYIPYQSLGNKEGLIKVYYLEYIRIQKEQQLLEFEMVPVGVADEALFQNKKYQMILNEEVL